MKVLARILSLVALASVVTLYTNCGGDDPAPASKEKVALEKLVGTWDLESVSDDFGERTDFVNVVMTIAGTYSTDGSKYSFSFTGTFPDPSPMPKTGGQFTFGADPSTQLIRFNDGVSMPYTLSSNGQTLQIRLDDYTGPGFAGGRVENVQGDWEFNFTKN